MSNAERNGPRAPHRSPPRPDRIQRIEAGFAAIPNRFLHDGFFASLSHAERALYLLLVLAGDRNGVSFYGQERICGVLEMSLDDYLDVRNGLIDKYLIAFDGTRFQVLSLPQQPIVRARPPLVNGEDMSDHDPATIRQIIRSSFDPRR